MKHAHVLAVPLVGSVLLGACIADDTDGPSLAAPEVIRVEAGSGGAAGMSADAPAAEQAATESVSGDEMASSVIAPWSVIVGFEVGGGLPALPTATTGWVHRAGREVPLERAVAMAEVLGVDPTPRTDREYDEWISHAFGPADGSAPLLEFGVGAEMDWWFSAAWGDDDTVFEPCREIETEDGIVYDCPTPEPPVGVPSAEEARARALELWERLGIDVAAADVEVWADEWYASVSASMPIEGVDAEAGWLSVGFGGGGALEYASGTLSRPEPAGPYPLIDLTAALERLRRYYIWPIDAVDVAVEPEVMIELGSHGPNSDTSMSDDPVIPEGGYEEFDPDPITVTVVDVAPDLWWTMDVEGNVWLIPAYAFTGDDGGVYTVPAVTDEYLVEEIPVAVDPIIEPTPEPAPEPVDPIIEPAPAPEESTPSEAVDMLMAILEEEGPMTEDQFSGLAESLGLTVRVVRLDGEDLAITMDLSPTRVNIEVADGLVVAVINLG